MNWLFNIVLLGGIFAIALHRFAPLYKKAGCLKLGIGLMFLFALCGMPSFYAVVSFVEAEPASRIRENGHDIPDDWTAGVMNHGTYYRWVLIEDRPVLFALSVAGLVVGVLPIQGLTLYALFRRT